jgi:uncharacterized protein YPO0396
MREDLQKSKADTQAALKEIRDHVAGATASLKEELSQAHKAHTTEVSGKLDDLMTMMRSLHAASIPLKSPERKKKKGGKGGEDMDEEDL